MKFTINVKNTGPSDASGVEVLDQLPTGYSFVSATPATEYNSSTGVWTLGAITNGSTRTLEVRATVLASGDHTNTAQISKSDQFDPNSIPGNSLASENDQASATPTIAGFSSVSGRVYADVGTTSVQRAILGARAWAL